MVLHFSNPVRTIFFPAQGIIIDMTDPSLMRAPATAISPLIVDYVFPPTWGKEYHLPPYRLSKEDRLNTWLFNLRLCKQWAICWKTDGVLRMPGYNNWWSTAMLKNRGRPQDNEPFFVQSDDWAAIAKEIDMYEDDPSFTDPARDTRKLRDITVMLWNKKREAQLHIIFRDHHLFIYLETASFFWELTGEDDAVRRGMQYTGGRGLREKIPGVRREAGSLVGKTTRTRSQSQPGHPAPQQPAADSPGSSQAPTDRGREEKSSGQGEDEETIWPLELLLMEAITQT